MVVKFIEGISQGWENELNVVKTESIADSLLIPNIGDNVYINGIMFLVVKKLYLYYQNEDKEIHIHLKLGDLSKTVK